MTTVRIIPPDSNGDLITIDNTGRRYTQYLDEWYKIERELEAKKFDEFVILEIGDSDSWYAFNILMWFLNKGYIIVLQSPIEDGELFLKKSALMRP